MKKIVKQMMALVLALALAITFMPVNVQAASVKVTNSRSGKIKAVYYKGGPAKKATFSMSSVKLTEKRENRETKAKYDVYEVTLNLKKAKMSKTDIVKTVKESKKKKGKIADYAFVILDADGNQITDGGIISGGLDYSASSSSKTLKAKEGNKRYNIWNWRKKSVYKFKIAIPEGKTGFYAGFAGLKKGQIKKSKIDDFNAGKISYSAAGFGSNKKGFVVAGSVTD